MIASVNYSGDNGIYGVMADVTFRYHSGRFIADVNILNWDDPVNSTIKPEKAEMHLNFDTNRFEIVSCDVIKSWHDGRDEMLIAVCDKCCYFDTVLVVAQRDCDPNDLIDRSFLEMAKIRQNRIAASIY